MSAECNRCYEASTNPAWLAHLVTSKRIDNPCPKHQPHPTPGKSQPSSAENHALKGTSK